MTAHALGRLLLQQPDLPVITGGPDEFHVLDDVEEATVIRCSNEPNLFFPDDDEQTEGQRVRMVKVT